MCIYLQAIILSIVSNGRSSTGILIAGLTSRPGLYHQQASILRCKRCWQGQVLWSRKKTCQALETISGLGAKTHKFQTRVYAQAEKQKQPKCTSNLTIFTTAAEFCFSFWTALTQLSFCLISCQQYGCETILDNLNKLGQKHTSHFYN